MAASVCSLINSLLAGASARLFGERVSRPALQRFLLNRGLWLVALEFSVVMFMWTFNFRYPLGLIMQVIWAIGASMCLLAGLVALPTVVVAGFALLLIAGHNLLDGVRPESWGAASPLWHILHVPGEIATGKVLYPLIPWVGVMAAGYVFGAVFKLDEARRRRLIARLGLGLTPAFVLLRLVDRYGTEVCLAHCAGEPVPAWVHAALPTLGAALTAGARTASAVDRECVDAVEAAVLAPHVGETFSAVGLDDRTIQLEEPAVVAACAGDIKVGERQSVRLTRADAAGAEGAKVEFATVA